MNRPMTVHQLLLKLLQVEHVHFNDPVVVVDNYRMTTLKIEQSILDITLESDDAGNAFVQIKTDYVPYDPRLEE